MLKALVLLSILGGALALSGCGSSDTSETQSTTNTADVQGKGGKMAGTGQAPPPAPEAATN